jgi:hypothetical protein
MIDLETGVLLQVLLYVDSSTAFRIRRCCQILEKLLAANRGLKMWRGVVNGTSRHSGSHTLSSGMWLHALIPEGDLSMYAMLSSNVNLAADLRFWDIDVVQGLAEGYCCMMQDAVAEKDAFLSGSHFLKGQDFFGSWEFDADRVHALLRGGELGLVRSSIVEFRCKVMQSTGCSGRKCSPFLGNLEFGVQLMLCHLSGGRCVLCWHPQVTNFGVLQENLDLMDIHLHGYLAVPAIKPLSYEGSLSTTNHHVYISQGYYSPAYTLSKSDVVKLLEHDCLLGAIRVRLYCMGDEVEVIPAAATSDPEAQKESWCFPEASNDTDLHDPPPNRSENGHEAMTTNRALCIWHGHYHQNYCSICWRALRIEYCNTACTET